MLHTSLLRISCAAILVASVADGARATAATPFSDYLVQAPKLAAPERGSVAGALANLSFEPGSMSRGEFGLPIPITLPGGRGAPLANVLPSYSPDGGQSEWGIGWRTDLTIQRTALVGDIDLDGDELVSPWGRLTPAIDGGYHPIGRAPDISLHRVNGGWEAVNGEGTKFTFAAADSVAGGYAWMLSQVDNVLGERTTLTYARNASGRPFVAAVEWGGRGDQRQYRADLAYDLITVPLEDYRSGTLLALDRRVREVQVSAKSAMSGALELVVSYQLDYTDSPGGAAFYLTGVTKTYRSGEHEPTQHYDYDFGTSTLASAALVDVPALDAVFAGNGNDALLPNKALVFDLEEDGAQDFELAKDQTLIRQHGGVFSSEALPVNPASNPLCRPPVNASNLPRTLARLTAEATEPQAIRTVYNSLTGMTRLLVCDRQGVPQSDQQVGGAWALGPNTHLVDLNHDQRPDLVRVFSRGYQVSENTSGPGGISFLTHAAGTLTESFTPDSSWVQDMNGDGQPDLVMRFSTSVMVWYGLGNFKFAPTGRGLSFKTVSGASVLDLAQRQLTFLDVNRDGLMDVITTRGRSVNLFINNGKQMREVSVPALAGLGWDFGVPVVADVTGTGNFALMFAQNLRAKALQLTTASTGLLVGAHDGKGTDISFSYTRSAAATGIIQRPVVLDTLTVASSGYDNVSYHYDYGAPTVHTLGKYLVGFASADKTAPVSRNHIEFHNDDDVSGVQSLAEQTDEQTPNIVRFTRSLYDDVELDGVRWLRPSIVESGHRNDDGSVTLSTTTQYASYERGFCPTVVSTTSPGAQLVHTTTLTTVAAIPDELHCLSYSENLLGSHTDPSLDFHYLIELSRNDVGQLTHAEQLGAGMQSLVLQDIGYNADHRVESVTVPGRGTTGVSYDALGRLETLTDPAGVVSKAAELDPLADVPLALATSRPGATATAYFQYDGHDRLQASWDDISGSSSGQPGKHYTYKDPTSAAPGRIDSQTLADAAAGISRQSVDLVAADGQTLASGAVLGDHVAFGTAVIAFRNTLTQKHSFVGVIPNAVVDTMTSTDLRSLGVQLGETISAGFGYARESTTTYQAGVSGTTTQELVLGATELVTRSHQPGGFTAESAVDATGNLVRKTDENGVVHRYRYDALGRLVHIDTPDGGHTVMLDSFGRPGRIARDGFGAVTYEYDPVSGLPIRRQRLDANEGVVDTTDSSYDAVGRVTDTVDSAAQATSALHFDYDGKLDTTTVPGQLGTLSRVRGDGWERGQLLDPLGRAYDQHVTLTGWRDVRSEKLYRTDGSVASDTLTVSDVTGATRFTTTKDTTLDSAGRIHTVAVDGATLYTLSYDDEGRLARADFTAGESIVFDYDAVTHAGLGHQIDAASVSGGVHWERDARGLVAAETYGNGATTTRREYHYDARGELTLATTGSDTASYSYTNSGLPETINDTGVSRTVHRVSDTLTVDNVLYAWDAAGRVIAKGDLAFEYGAHDQLIRATRPGRQIDYTYDDHNERLLKRIDGVPVRANVAGGVLTEDHFVEVVSIGGVVAGVLDNGQFSPVLADPRGTPFADGNGAPAFASPYGVRASHSALAEVIDYARLGWDPDLDLVRMGARDYDARLSQFTTPDPLYFEDLGNCQGSPLQCALYGYAAGDPIGFIDPTGLGVWSWLGDRVGGAARLATAFVIAGASVAACTTGVGCALGAAGLIYAADLGGAGATDAVLGTSTPTLTNQAIARVVNQKFADDAELAVATAVTTWKMTAPRVAPAPVSPAVTATAAAAAAARNPVWELTPFERGVAIEKVLGQNLPQSFPTIDRFADGVATSIKSLDLAAKSYQAPAAIISRLTKYAKTLAEFDGAKLSGVQVNGADITRKVLEVAVPGAGTAAQQAALQTSAAVAQSIGVTLVITQF